MLQTVERLPEVEVVGSVVARGGEPFAWVDGQPVGTTARKGKGANDRHRLRCPIYRCEYGENGGMSSRMRNYGTCSTCTTRCCGQQYDECVQ